MSARGEVATKEDLEGFKEEIIHEFHVISEGLIDHIKLLAEGHSGLGQRLDRLGHDLDEAKKDNERQHLETRALIKISFSDLDRRLSDLESQVRDLQEWKKKIEARLQR